MPDGELAAKAGENLLVEHLADETQILDHGDLAGIADRHPSALLTAMLEGIQPKVSKPRYVVTRRVDAKYTARIMEVIGLHDVSTPRELGQTIRK